LKGKKPQYHSQVAKEEGTQLYQQFVDTITTAANSEPGKKAITVRHGTFGM
jgi:D-Tyr-tRNAtyr deacylase